MSVIRGDWYILHTAKRTNRRTDCSSDRCVVARSEIQYHRFDTSRPLSALRLSFSTIRLLIVIFVTANSLRFFYALRIRNACYPARTIQSHKNTTELPYKIATNRFLFIALKLKIMRERQAKVSIYLSCRLLFTFVALLSACSFARAWCLILRMHLGRVSS